MRILVVYCHPASDSYCAALRDAALDAFARRGDEVRLLDLYAENFDPVMTAEARRTYNDGQPTDPIVLAHAEHLRWAQGIVFVYPTWWYGLPAMLKGWFDRVWATDVAFKLPADGGRILSLVSHMDRIAVVTTCGAPWLFSILIGEPGRKTILRGIRALCATRCKRLFLAHYDMDRSTAETRAKFVEKVRERLERF